MEIRVDARNVELPSNAGVRLRARVQRVLARLTAGVTRVHLTLKDVDGPRNGRGKVCMLRAELSGGGQVVVVDRSVRLGRAFVRCLRRSRRIISREIKRRRVRAMVPAW